MASRVLGGLLSSVFDFCLTLATGIRPHVRRSVLAECLQRQCGVVPSEAEGVGQDYVHVCVP